MKQYIDKDTIIAEIERRIKYDEMVMDHDAQITELLSRELNTLYELSSFIKSLDTKEVDLEKEATEFVQTKEFVENKENPVLLIAKHFFELGLKTQKGELSK